MRNCYLFVIHVDLLANFDVRVLGWLHLPLPLHS